MSGFTNSEVGDFSSSTAPRKLKIDSKGRISIPADIRRSFGLNGDVFLDFDLEEGVIFLYGRCGAVVSIGDCGSPDAGSKQPFSGKYGQKVCTPKTDVGNPATDPLDISRKKIGIIGGMGPESTVLFYKKIIKKCQEFYGAKYDSDYPEIFIYNLPIPDVVEKIEDKRKLLKMLIEAIKKTEFVGADFIVIPCNTVQVIFDDIRKYANIPVFNIIEETMKRVNKSQYKKTGLLATKNTIKNKLYNKLSENGIEIILSEKSDIEKINKIILKILSGKASLKDKKSLQSIIKSLFRKGAESIIIGCTDLSLLTQDKYIELKMFDSLDILAEVTVKRSYGNIT